MTDTLKDLRSACYTLCLTQTLWLFLYSAPRGETAIPDDFQTHGRRVVIGFAWILELVTFITLTIYFVKTRPQLTNNKWYSILIVWSIFYLIVLTHGMICMFFINQRTYNDDGGENQTRWYVPSTDITEQATITFLNTDGLLFAYFLFSMLQYVFFFIVDFEYSKQVAS